MNKKIKKAYRLIMKLNDQVFDIETDSLQESILLFQPKHLKTKIKFEIYNKKGEKCERMVFVQRAKMMFRNKLALDLFVRTINFKSPIE